MRAEHLAQRGMEQVRAGVVAADGVAALTIDDGAHVVANGQRLLEQGLVRADALHGQNAAVNLGDGRVAVGGGEAGQYRPSVRLNRRRSWSGRGRHRPDRRPLAAGTPSAVFDDGQHFGAGASELLVAEEVGLGQFAKGRAGGFLAAALPTGAGAGLLLGAGGFKAFAGRMHAGIARGIDHEVQRKAKSLIQMEGLCRQ